MNPPCSRRHLLSSAFAASACDALSPFAFGQEKLSVAVIGHTGRGNFGHGLDTLWLQIPETNIVAVSDPDEAGREKARKKL